MIYVQTNDAEANEVRAFTADLRRLGAYPTGGRGDGQPHLPSQGSLALAGRRLLVANAGSGDVSLFAVETEGLSLLDVVPAGPRPVSVTVHDGLVYVLSGGMQPGIAGFRLAGGTLEPLATRALAAGTDPAQIGFTPDGTALVVTERGTNAIEVFPVEADGRVGDPVAYPSAGATPYGFDFAGGTLVVTEAFGGAVGAAAASSYRLDGTTLRTVSPSVGDGRSEVCWAVGSADGRSVWVTNFGDGTVSRYAVGADGSLELADPVAASTVLGSKGIRDAARSAGGGALYALDADERTVFGWRIEDGGALEPIGAVDGLPATAAGLVAL